MRLLAVIFGIALIVLVALDAFETIVLPRRVTRRIRLTRLFYRVFQFGSTSLGRLIRSSARRDAFRGYMGPLSLFALLLFWAVLSHELRNEVSSADLMPTPRSFLL